MNTLIDSIKDKNSGLGVDKHKDEYGIETVTLQIEGMGCGCEWSMVEQKMKALAGVRRAELNPMTKQLRVSYDPGATTIQDIIRSVSETGMKASLVKSQGPRSTWWREKQQLALYGCGLLALIAFASGQLGATHVVTIALITSVMAFKGLPQPEIFLQIEIARRAERIRTGQNIEMVAPPPAPDILQGAVGMIHKEKYKKSCLANERAAEIARKLLQLMDREKLFLNPELTLSELANRLAVSPNDLSQVINREMNKCFFDFVNEYRVREARRLLSSPKHSHLSILGISLDAGFNSKSAFYSAFSKHIGTTPSGFRKHYGLADHSAASNHAGLSCG